MEKASKKPVEIPSPEQVRRERDRLRYRSRFQQTMMSTIGILIVAAALAVLVATILMPVLRIYGSSMEPSLHDGQIVVCVKTSHFESGDLVAFYHGNKLLIKRCIAGAGEWVDLDKEGNLYVNGELLEEPYLAQKAFGETDIDLPYQIPDGRWFMVGDNRAVSVDSRSSVVGCIADEQIVGKIVFRVWPLTKFGTVK